MSYKLKHPFNCIIAGPSGCGKTIFMRRLLAEFSDQIDINVDLVNVLWAHGQAQQLHKVPVSKANITYYDGLPSENELDEMRPDIIVIDDLMTEIANNKTVTNLFSKYGHHNNVSVFFLTQNIFHGGSQTRSTSLNSHYMVCFKNPRDERQIEHVGRQVTPRSYPKHFFIEVFESATKDNHGYLLIDCHPKSSLLLKFRTRIFRSDNTKGKVEPIVYLPPKYV